MRRYRTGLGAGLLALAVAAGTLPAQQKEAATVDSATEVLQALAAVRLKGIPPALLYDARGVAVLPHVVKAGLVVGGRFGRGVLLVRGPDGCWSNPVFVTLAGGGIGGQVGIQSTDLVLVFKTRGCLDRLLQGKGKVALGADVAVAAGPVGRQAGAGTDAQLQAEIYSYSRSRGLFAGVSLEGAGLRTDREADEAFYGLRGGRAEDGLALRGVPLPAAERLRAQLTRMSTPPAPPPVVPPPTAPPPLLPPTPPPARAASVKTVAPLVPPFGPAVRTGLRRGVPQAAGERSGLLGAGELHTAARSHTSGC
jgi:lipid-binding SYLF domain-containing protein